MTARGISALCLCAGVLAEVRAATESVVVELRTEARTSGDQVLLSDIADLSGPRESIAALLDCPVVRSPKPGGVRTMTKPEIVEALRAGPAAKCVVSGAAEVQVRAEALTVSGASFADAAVEAIQKYFSDQPELQATVEATSVPAAQCFRPGAVELKPELPTGEWFAGPRTVHVRVLRDARQVGEATVGVRVRFQRHVPVAACRLEAGETLTEACVAMEWRDTISAKQYVGLGVERLLARQARSAVPAGRILEGRFFKAVPIIRRGEQVTLRVTRGALTITALAEARADAEAGATVLLRLTDSGAEVRARAAGPGEAEL